MGFVDPFRLTWARRLRYIVVFELLRTVQYSTATAYPGRLRFKWCSDSATAHKNDAFENARAVVCIHSTVYKDSVWIDSSWGFFFSSSSSSSSFALFSLPRPGFLIARYVVARAVLEHGPLQMRFFYSSGKREQGRKYAHTSSFDDAICSPRKKTRSKRAYSPKGDGVNVSVCAMMEHDF